MPKRIPQSGTSNSPYAALKYPQFVAYIISYCFITLAYLAQDVVLGYYVYKITHDPLALGFIGLAKAVPYIALALFGGHLADRFNRKIILLVSLGSIIIGSLVLIWATSPIAGLSQQSLLTIVYSVVIWVGFSNGFFNPAFNSLNAYLIPKEIFTNATTWQSSFWQAGAILGPVFGGFLYALVGLTFTLWFVLGLLVITMILISTITSLPSQIKQNQKINIFDSLYEGISFVFKTKIILYATSLDLFSVLFGGVIALLPVYSEDILHVGPEGLGILRAAPSVGAMLTMIILIYYPPIKKAWQNLLLAVGGFGIFTLVFAISSNLWLSASALFLTGGFDSVNVIIRQTIIYFFTPDEMRGRVSSVNGIFISSSSELGAFESGLAAKLLGTVPSVIFGGAMTMIIVIVVWFRSKTFMNLKLHSSNTLKS